MSDFSSVEPLYNQANQATQNLSSMAGQAGGLPQMLRDAVSERFSQSPLFKQREEATQNFITALPQARTELASLVQAGAAGQPGGQILSPNQQQSILSGRRAALTVPLMSLNDLLQAQTGGVETAIQGGIGAFNAQLQAAQLDAQAKRQAAEDALNLLMQKSAESRAERSLALQEATAGSGGGGGIGDIFSFLSGLQGGGSSTSPKAPPTETKPTYRPMQLVVDRLMREGTNVNSPGGEWYWDPSSNQWLPEGFDVVD